ncbi:hypothetical protein EES43_26710 [Streptomyces sp. ADI96-02]|nr:hypothetical protein EES43_26710 [Streptomyces sp. ADI96-02]
MPKLADTLPDSNPWKTTLIRYRETQTPQTPPIDPAKISKLVIRLRRKAKTAAQNVADHRQVRPVEITGEGAPTNKIFFMAHGWHKPGEPDVLLPHDWEERIRFYAHADVTMDIPSMLTIAHLRSLGDETPLPPGNKRVPNYYYARMERNFVEDLKILVDAPGFDGKDAIQAPGLNLADSMRLCGMNSPGCEEGVHECSGVLGIFKNLPIDIMSCRVESSEGHEPQFEIGKVLEGLSIDGIIGDKIRTLLRQDRRTGNLYDGKFIEWLHSMPPRSQVLAKASSTVATLIYWGSAREISNDFADEIALGRFVGDMKESHEIRYNSLWDDSYKRWVITPMVEDASWRRALLLTAVFYRDPDGFEGGWPTESSHQEVVDRLRKDPKIAAWIDSRPGPSGT